MHRSCIDRKKRERERERHVVVALKLIADLLRDPTIDSFPNDRTRFFFCLLGNHTQVKSTRTDVRRSRLAWNSCQRHRPQLQVGARADIWNGLHPAVIAGTAIDCQAASLIPCDEAVGSILSSGGRPSRKTIHHCGFVEKSLSVAPARDSLKSASRGIGVLVRRTAVIGQPS